MAPGHLSPSERPDRTEGLLTAAVDASGLLCECCEIVRPPDKRPRMGRTLYTQDDLHVERVGCLSFLDVGEVSDEGKKLFAELIPQIVSRDYFALRRLIPRAVYERDHSRN